MTTSTAPAPPTAAPAPPAGGGPAPDGDHPRELLVVLRRPADLTGPLVRAAALARAADRPLSVVVVEPTRAWTVGAALVAPQDGRRRQVASMIRAAGAVCARTGVEVRDVVVLRSPRAWARGRGERDVRRRSAMVAEVRRAELHEAAPVVGPLVGDVR